MSNTPHVDQRTFGQVLAETAARHPQRDAMVFPHLGSRWTWAEFERDVKRAARALLALGVRPGDHVGIWATNWPEWVLLQFATAQFGAVLVNVNPAYRTKELAYIVAQADLHTLFLTDAFKDSNFEHMAAELIPALVNTPFGTPLQDAACPKLRHVVSIKNRPAVPGIMPWDTFLDGANAISEDELIALAAKVRPEMPVNIQYTSGTTGAPKGAMLSHSNLLLNAYHTGQGLGASEIDRLCIPVPFYHCFGCVLGTLLCGVYGAAMIIPAEAFDPEATLKAIAAERATILYGVPTMFNAQLHHPAFANYDCTSLRTGIMAGSPCPIELMKQVVEKMHLREMAIAYGLTEASPVITLTSVDEPLEIRCGTVGKPIPGVEVRLVDPATGQDAPEGGQGELWARGHNIMLGYYNKPEETKNAVTEDGWLRTGDLAQRTPAGHYRITGRSKDVIIRGGENVYPRELEEYLMAHPKIRDVQVVGLPDEKFGEQVSAWIVPADPALTPEEIRAYCKDKIAYYKIPHYIEFVNEYPLTVTGKVQKYRLRELGIQRHNLNRAAQIETA